MLDDNAQLQRDSVFSIGRVVSVDGRRVRVQVDKLKNGAHLLYNGNVVRNVSVASYIKITKGFVELVAAVDGEHVKEDRTVSTGYKRVADPLLRQLDVSLIGYLEGGKFVRGIRELPLLDNECFILDEAEFQQIHAFVGPNDVALSIGSLSTEPTQEVKVGVSAIFASHIGIFGNTGSGKSYTLSKLYHELFKQFEASTAFRTQSRFVLIDFNGEYVDRPTDAGDPCSTSVITSKSNKREYVLSTRRDDGARIPLPKAAVEDIAFWTVLLDATERTQAPFLARVLSSDFWEKRLADPADLLNVVGDMVLRATKSTDSSVDRQTVFNLLEEIQTCLGSNKSDQLADLIEEFRRKLHYNSTMRKFYWGAWSPPIIDPDNASWEAFTSDKVKALSIDFSALAESGVDLIRFKIVLQYYSDIISGFANREHLGPLIKRMETRVPDVKKLIEVGDEPRDTPLVVVSLRDVNLSMRKVVPMLLCKHLYDQKKVVDPDNETYLNLIIDEAHNILSTESTRESEAWRDYRLETFEEIIKEGRKFGVFLTIASQRPHDISPTIISQLHNYFLHRLVNNLDILAVERAVAYLDRVSFESLPILPTGACILAGVSAQVPVILKVSPLAQEFEPNSRTMTIASRWMTEAE